MRREAFLKDTKKDRVIEMKKLVSKAKKTIKKEEEEEGKASILQ